MSNTPLFPIHYSSPYLHGSADQKNEDYSSRYLNYIQDKSLTEYAVNEVGRFIKENSIEQIETYKECTQMIIGTNVQGFLGLGELMTTISNETIEEIKKSNDLLKDSLQIQQEIQMNQARQTSEIINTQIETTNAIIGMQQQVVNVIGNIAKHLDTKMNAISEQLDLNNSLLQEITDSLKIPDSVKQRMMNIDLACKFLKASETNKEYVKDALDNFLKAEVILNSDSFVLYQIGMLYMYEPSCLNLPLAIKYFSQAAKYSQIEGVNNGFYKKEIENYTHTNTFTSKAFYQAALGCFVSLKYSDAFSFIELSQKHEESDFEAKYLKFKILLALNKVDDGILILDKVIEGKPEYLAFLVNDFGLMQNKEVIGFLEKKRNFTIEKLDLLLREIEVIKLVDSQLNESIDDIFKNYKSAGLLEVIKTLNLVTDSMFSLNYETEYFLSKSFNTEQNLIDTLIIESKFRDEIKTLLKLKLDTIIKFKDLKGYDNIVNEALKVNNSDEIQVLYKAISSLVIMRESLELIDFGFYPVKIEYELMDVYDDTGYELEGKKVNVKFHLDINQNNELEIGCEFEDKDVMYEYYNLLSFKRINWWSNYKRPAPNKSKNFIWMNEDTNAVICDNLLCFEYNEEQSPCVTNISISEHDLLFCNDKITGVVISSRNKISIYRAYQFNYWLDEYLLNNKAKEEANILAAEKKRADAEAADLKDKIESQEKAPVKDTLKKKKLAQSLNVYFDALLAINLEFLKNGNSEERNNAFWNFVSSPKSNNRFNSNIFKKLLKEDIDQCYNRICKQDGTLKKDCVYYLKLAFNLMRKENLNGIHDFRNCIILFCNTQLEIGQSKSWVFGKVNDNIADVNSYNKIYNEALFM